jgi:hypothetical protein
MAGSGVTGSVRRRGPAVTAFTLDFDTLDKMAEQAAAAAV